MSDEIFDPEIHATDREGNPSLNKDGSFRKKRRDAGKSGARSKTAKAAPADDRARYAKAVQEALAIPVMVASFVDPVDGYCAAELSPVFADAIAGLAVENPQVAAVCEKLAIGGAAGAVAAVVLMAGVQFAHNHGKIPEHLARMAGAKPRREIEAILRARGEQLAAQARVTEAPADAEGARAHAA
jgi:hypothetical protein